jgi:hypothetical protein
MTLAALTGRGVVVSTLGITQTLARGSTYYLTAVLPIRCRRAIGHYRILILPELVRYFGVHQPRLTMRPLKSGETSHEGFSPGCLIGNIECSRPLGLFSTRPASAAGACLRRSGARIRRPAGRKPALLQTPSPLGPARTLGATSLASSSPPSLRFSGRCRHTGDCVARRR